MSLTTDLNPARRKRSRRKVTSADGPAASTQRSTPEQHPAVDRDTGAPTTVVPLPSVDRFTRETVLPAAFDPETLGSAAEDPVAAAPGRRKWNQRYAQRLLITDVLALIAAGIGVHLIAVPAIPTAVSSKPGYPPFIAATIGLVVIWFCALTWADSRDVKVVGHGPVEYKRVLQASFGLFGLVAIVSFLFQLDLPRSYLLIMLPTGLVALLASRYLWRRWLRRQRAAGHYMSQVLAVGDRHAVAELVRDLRRAPLAGYRVVGVCLAQDVHRFADEPLPSTIEGVPVLGGVDDVAEIARSCAADTVAVTSSAGFGPGRVRKLSWELEDTAAELILAPALTNIAGPRVHTHPVAGLPLIHVDRPTYRGANRMLKKTFDVVTSAWMVLLLSPLLIGVAIAIKATSKGPVFFRQDRVGINGDIFRMIKFRSMVVDAEAGLANLQDAQRDAGNKVLFKLKNDPRVTTVGKFIRRYSIDELPQLFNVLIGQMSLVGPRPPLKAEVDRYEDEARRRLLVKPGMTGLWQVSGRSDLSWDESVRLDIYYVENWSITGDLVIVGKTAKAVLSSSGAY